jgi:hypothetical protein
MALAFGIGFGARDGDHNAFIGSIVSLGRGHGAALSGIGA